MMPNPVPEVAPLELDVELKGTNPPILIDVREDFERNISKLSPDVHVPMNELLSRLGELDPESDLVIYCRTGSRSAAVTAFLLRQGFKKVRNLSTGINGWARDIDPGITQY